MEIILKNEIQCKKCGDIIESKSTYDFKMCTCGACAVDGGREYLRRVGYPNDFIELSVLKTVEDK